MVGRSWIALLSVLAAALAADPGCAHAQPAAAHRSWPGQVSTLAGTDRLLRDSLPGTQTDVRMAAARNEWEGFQVFVQSDGPVAGVSLVPGDLVGPRGTILLGADARLYREHQMEIRTGSNHNTSFRPGGYPDALIPARHPLTGLPLPKARYAAMPFDLPAGETHGFFADIYVPSDAPAGEYRGTYHVTAADGRMTDVPVTLTVWDFALPATPAMQTAFGNPADRIYGYYKKRAEAGKDLEVANRAALEAQCAEMLSRHRINATPPAGTVLPRAGPDGTFRVSPAEVKALRQFVDQYHINAFQVGRPQKVIKDPDAEPARLKSWLAAWDRAAAELNRPQVVFYTYLIDEPGSAADYALVRKWGEAVRERRSVVKVMVTEQPDIENPAWGNLLGAVDIWCPLFPLFRPGPAAERQALGETIWVYTALCQESRPTPWWQIDFPLLNYRVPMWISWRYRIRGILYWGDIAHWREVEDPWTDPWTYGRKGDGGLVYNGEGTLLYPGRACGYEGAAPSLRLKALRDGLDDYDYLAILEKAGLAAEAEKIILPLAGSWFQWNKDPAAYQEARARLAALIVGSKRK